MLLEEVAGAKAATRVAAKLLEALDSPVEVAGRPLHAGASAGISLFPADGDEADTLLKNADAAMYAAKQAGRGRYQLFTPAIANAASEQFTLESELREALEEGGLVLHYQPKVSLPDGELIGLEALVRWQHPEHGLVGPAHFLEPAREAGLLPVLTRQVLRMAARDCRRWRERNACRTRIAVNLDTETLNEPGLVEMLLRITAEEGIAPTDLELEIVETAVLRTEAQSELLTRLVEAGFELSIDDFGTGESSLGRLKQLPITTLKIDRAFVRDLERDDNDRAIIRAIIAMARTLGKQTLAEGVETEAQLRFLAEAGCDAIQGYFCARPAPAAEVEPQLAPGHFRTRVRAAATRTAEVA